MSFDDVLALLEMQQTPFSLTFGKSIEALEWLSVSDDPREEEAWKDRMRECVARKEGASSTRTKSDDGNSDIGNGKTSSIGASRC